MESKEGPLRQLHLILLMFLLFISGCAQKSSLEKRQTEAINKDITTLNWDARGKLAFIAPNDRQSANFNWRYEEKKQRLILTSFIGTQIFALQEHDEFTEIKIEGETRLGQDSKALIYEVSGLDIPVGEAPFWLTANVDSEYSQYDAQNRITTTQWHSTSGKIWSVTYQSYQKQDGLWLPKRLTLTHEKLKIKLQINSWQINK